MLEDVVEYRMALEGFIEGAKLGSVILCGHAMGAAIALDYTVNHPREVEGLVLMDFGGTFPGAADSAADLLANTDGYRAQNGRRGLSENASAAAVDEERGGLCELCERGVMVGQHLVRGRGRVSGQSQG